MDWASWPDLEPHAFAQQLRLRLIGGISYRQFLGLHDELLARAFEGTAGLVGPLIAAALPELEARSRSREIALFLELAAKIACLTCDFQAARQALEALRKLPKRRSRRSALEAAKAVWAHAQDFGSSVDQIASVLAIVAAVLKEFEAYRELAELHLEAASHYSRHGASQAAYRSVADAESIAHDLRDARLLVKVYRSAAITAADEDDYEWSAVAANHALAVLASIGNPPPPDLLNNLAVAEMNLKQHSLAADHFREALAAHMIEPGLRGAILTNLSACLRKTGDLEGASWALKEAYACIDADTPTETRLELELVGSRLAEALGDTDRITRHLRAAATLLDETISQVFRLHHRRGLRERFTVRFEALLNGLPPTGRAQDVLAPLAIIRGNRLGDWLAVLDWFDSAASDPRVAEHDKAALKSVMDQLREFGAPHQFGFREKYDDAWQPMNLGDAWDDFSRLAARLTDVGITPPMAKASLAEQVGLCERRLMAGHSLMLTTIGGGTAKVWLLIGDIYRNVEIETNEIASWAIAKRKHGADELTRVDFSAATQRFVEHLRSRLGPLLDAVAAAGSRSLRVIQDFNDSLPITPLAIGTPKLAIAMASGSFEVRFVPALHEAHDGAALVSPSVTAVVDTDDGLLLARHEGVAFAEAIGASALHIVEAKAEQPLGSALGQADALVVSTHSPSLSLFTDPYFASMGGVREKHVVNVEQLQKAAPDLKASVVVLNACHSGSGSARNFQFSFRTADKVSFPALFVLNRKAVVSATEWKTSDTAGYTYAKLLGRALLQGLSPSAAITMVIANFAKVTKSEVLEALADIADDDVRDRACARISGAPESMFSDIYLSGGFALHGLM